MDPTLLALLILGLLFTLLAAGMPIGFAMGLSAFVGTLLLIDGQAALALLGQTAYETAFTYNLSVVPMFVLMGYIAGGAGLSESLYRACNAWLGHRRGGLALATIGACGALAGERLAALKSVWGPAALFLLVIGGLYIGIFSPTEAASVGAVGAFALGIINHGFDRAALASALLDTVKTTAMIFTILIGAILFNNFLILASMPTLVSGWIAALPLGKTAILLVIIGMYFILGCLLDSLSMILLTIPIVFPIISALGYEPVWFGIIIVMVVELGLITPPIGMNVFVIKGIARDVPLETIFRGVTPFIVAQVILILILVAFPEIALLLPSTMER